MADETPMNEGVRETATETRPDEGVAHELARARAARISDLRYRLHLELEPGAPRIKAEVEIALKLRATSDPLVIDFRDLDENGKVIDGRVSGISANGNPVTGHQQINGHIVIPGAHFKNGENNLKIAFDTGVAPTGRPVIRYLDRDDGGEYIYTLFVPMDASLAFPCFDQPDLKGRFTLDISAPNSWTVIGNSPISQTSAAARESYRRTRFEETQPISTYLVSFAAGPFAELAGAGSSTPLRLFVRQSKLDRAREEWPEVERLTREGLRYLSDFFAHQFPFAKYDQVLIPGFAYGGMEHVGATFLREDSILFRATPTTSDKLGRASLILHELTHQWFGDLVTMRWFDDLWLKEGFATYMAYRAMADIYPPREIWKRFSQTLKPAAYGIDSTKGTTPIYQEVPNLKDAKSAYGAIVYQKAPAVLHALSFTIGDGPFRKGVQLFLKEHAYANAEWGDLIGAFERASKQRLNTWAEAWVRRRGMPQIDLDWSCDGAGKIARFEVKQRDVLDEGGRWPIRSQLMLAYEDSPAERLTFSLNGENAIIKEAVGRRCPVYVFSNDGDYGYGRFPLDVRSRAAVITRIDRITDPFERSMLWGALWDAVRVAELTPAEYIKLATRLLAAESDEELAQNLIGRVTTAFQRYLSEKQQAAIAADLEQLCFERMMKAESLGMRIIYFRAFRALATSPDGRAKLKEMLAGKLTPPGLEIKPLDRWQILRTILAIKDHEAEALLAAERQRDATDDGRKQAYVIEAARADAATKRRYFDDYLSNRNMPEDWVEGSLGGFNAWNQAGLSAPYLKPALEALPQMKRERKIFFVLAWLNAFIGGQRSAEALTTVRDFLRDSRLDRDLQLKVLEVTDELERTAKIRTKFAVE
jgi:aminopeptidase N